MRKLRFLAVSASILFGLSVLAYGALASDYYVVPAQPNSIQKALDAAQPGDTILLSPGVYFQDVVTRRNGSAGSPISIKGTPGAIVKGAGNSRIFEINHDNIILDGFTIDGLHGSQATTSGYRDKLIYIVGTGNKDGVLGSKIVNMTLRNAGGECVRMKYFSRNNEVARNNISNCGVYDFKFGGAKNGEGIYIGTAPEQLYKNPTPDIDNTNNNFIHNNIINTQGNEGVDVKEGSSGNIIEYNSIDAFKFTKPDEEDTQTFMDILAANKVNARLRRSRGKDIDAACGQLANKG